VFPADQVLLVLDTLNRGGWRVWLDGGWGVDALLGEVTRAHDDVDLVVELDALPAVLDALATLGFSVTENLAPVRVVLRSSDGLQVDLHPVTFAEDGTGWQRGASPDGSDCPYPAESLGEGRILDRVVPCLTAELQLEHHGGYAPRDHDRMDMARLATRFGLSLREPY
jgi:lincosamide nucleotidyltransferase A/C/D/E